MVHRLKTHAEPLDAILRGDKTFEYRRDDRRYAEGDKVVLFHWDPETETSDPQRPHVVADVGYVLRGPAYGIPEGFCAFSLLNACTPHGLIRPRLHNMSDSQEKK